MPLRGTTGDEHGPLPLWVHSEGAGPFPEQPTKDLTTAPVSLGYPRLTVQRRVTESAASVGEILRCARKLATFRMTITDDGIIVMRRLSPSTFLLEGLFPGQ